MALNLGKVVVDYLAAASGTEVLSSVDCGEARLAVDPLSLWDEQRARLV